ncbi:MAG: flagellar motor switch protein FliN [Rhizobiales bacterium]|nr:flagellar motor switch protein FliN [Hyphomicrobiales bacterium]
MSEDQAKNDDLELTDFSENASDKESTPEADTGPKQVEDLQAVYDVPVKISAVLGRTNLEISDLLDLDEGDVIELDRKVGEAIDLYVNNRLVARGEVVLVDEKLGVTMTEIISNKKD